MHVVTKHPQLSTELLASIRAELEAERRARAAAIANGPPPDVDADDAEQLVAPSERLVTELGEAIARIDDGTYGLCTRCGAPIPPARLEALPSASRCVGCAS